MLIFFSSLKSLYKLITIGLFLSLVGCQEKKVIQEAYAPKPIKANGVLEYLHKMLEEPELKGASLGLYVTTLGKDSSLVAYMPEVSLATASTLKALTTATAINILGKDYRFETEIAYSGQIDDKGTLNGNLYLIGGGDPTLGSDNMPSLMDFLANRVIEKGIKNVEGSLIGDASIFDTRLAANTWIWEDVGNYYGAGPSGLTIHLNQYSIYFKTGIKEGDPTEIVKIVPDVKNLTIKNEVTTGKKRSGDNAYIYGGPFNNKKIVRGTLPPGHASFMIKGALPEPSNFCTSYFFNTLQKKGVTFSKPIQLQFQQEKKSNSLTTIYTQKSNPLSQIIKETNFKSINLYADAMLKLLGNKKGKEGSFKEGVNVIKDFWGKEGIDMENIIIEDGSGLSRYNAVSAHTMTEIIRHTVLKDSSKAFINSLPIVGKSGTLKNISKNGISNGRIKAKSGYIKNVRAYTGTITTFSEKELVFTLLINNHTKSYREMTTNIEDIFDLLVRL